MLTCKQYELLLFIHNHIKETGVSPSFEEMKNALELSSKSGIHKLVIALEQRGFIRRLLNRARAVEVIRLPEKITFNLSLARKISPSMIEKNKREISKNLTNLGNFEAEEKKISLFPLWDVFLRAFPPLLYCNKQAHFLSQMIWLIQVSTTH